MVFSEPVFLFLFLPVALAGILAAIRAQRGEAAVLFGLSAVFYYWSSGALVLLLLGSVLLNGLLARRIAGGDGGRWLVAGVVANLAVLAIFKYAGFAAENLDAIAGTSTHAVLGGIALPVGISFFTFQGVSYLIDVARGHVEAERSLIRFGAYLTFFPQLIAGPIVRYRDVAEEYRNPRPGLERATYGIRRFTHGLVKKIVIADSVAPIADACFALAPATRGPAEAWLGATAYAVQIYFDFSGYSDMAIGLAAICGITLHENFDRPYASATLTEFWRRWHISLSSWFRDYLYIPLGGNRGGDFAVHRNLLIVFAATGLWHGAAWNFLAWGAYHGLFLVLERRLVARERLAHAGRGARFAYALPVTIFGWVLFRAADLTAALDYWRAMLGLAGASPGARALAAEVLQSITPLTAVALVLGATCFLAPRDHTAATLLRADASPPREALRTLYVALGLFVCGWIALTSDFSPFLYFRF